MSGGADLSKAAAACAPTKFGPGESRPSPLWGFVWKVGVCYLFLYVPFTSVWMIPGTSSFADDNDPLWRRIVPWVWENILQVHEPMPIPRGGASMFPYVQALGMLILALIAGAVWGLLDRRHRYDAGISRVIQIMLRYVLAANMLEYGIDKLLRTQMPAPTIFRMMQTYGEVGPRDLLWTFMGQSWVYSAFTGGAEWIGGILLLFGRTTLLGSLILTAVLLNVVLLNFCFDVGVKLYSMHLLLFAVLLWAGEFRRLSDALVSTRWADSQVASSTVMVERSRSSLLLKWGVVMTSLWLYSGTHIWAFMQRPPRIETKWFGIWDVEEYRASAATALSWRQVGIDAERNGQAEVTVIQSDGSMLRFTLAHGPEDQFTLQQWRDRPPPAPPGLRPAPKAPKEPLRLVPIDADRIAATATLGGAALSMKLRRADPSKLRLRNTEFSWIRR